MPFYTFKCRTCNLEENKLRKMDDFTEPLCPKCCYNPDAQGKYEKMKKVVSSTGKPQLSVTSGGKKVKLYDTPEEAQERAEDAAKKAEDTE